MFHCKICRCPPAPYNMEFIAMHNSGKRHRKLLDLFEKKEILEAWGIELSEEADIKYTCIPCNKKMELSFQKMEHHFKATHYVPSLEVTKVCNFDLYFFSLSCLCSFYINKAPFTLFC